MELRLHCDWRLRRRTIELRQEKHCRLGIDLPLYLPTNLSFSVAAAAAVMTTTMMPSAVGTSIGGDGQP